MRVVIIGNGIAANAAASRVRQLDPQAEAVIISEEPFPLYSACVLANYVGQEIDRERVFLTKTADYSEQGIRLLLGRKATALDTSSRKVFLESGDISYDKLIIAAGSEPVVPPIDGVDKRGIFAFKSITDADKVCQHSGQRAVVVGSGPIGIEVAMALKRRGYQVSLIELLEHILPRVFDRDLAWQLQNLLEEQGIEVLTGEKVIRFLGSSSVEAAVTDRRQIKCDLAILAAGMRPRVSLAQQAGLEIGGLGGIKTNDHMLTNAPDVYTCGDCVQGKDRVTGEDSLSLLWHNARQQGEVAGSNAGGVLRRYPGSLDITSINIFDTQAVSIGKNLVSLGPSSVEVIESRLRGAYYRLLVSHGVLAGIQVMGRARDVGVLLNTLQRRDELRELAREVLHSGLVPTTAGWHWKLVGYLGDAASGDQPTAPS